MTNDNEYPPARIPRRSLCGAYSHWPFLVLEYSRKWKDVFLQVPTSPEVLGIIQYYHDVTHTGIRTTIHAVLTKYTWKGFTKILRLCK